MTATVSITMKPGNTRAIDMASYEPLPGRGLRSIGIWCVLVAVIFLVWLSGMHHVSAQAQPTDTQILELLKKKRSMRCPTNPSEGGCGGTSTSPVEAEIVDIFFDFGSAVLDRRAHASLSALAAGLNRPERAGRRFLIGGHADAMGSKAYNQRLSERRAEAVKRVLVQEFRLPAETLVAVGYGKTRLKNSANPFAPENRRVRIMDSEVK